MKFKNILLAIVSIILSLIIAEILVRIIAPVDFKKNEKNLIYRYDDSLGWFPKENSKDRYSKDTAPRKVLAEHNNLGFRDDEFADDINKPNIIFLGDSFTWGYDVEKDERFSEILRKENHQYDIYNLGVSGYGTDQEFLLLKKYYDQFKPKIIFLVFCNDNDYLDNSSNNRYGGYFKPYFEYKNDSLVLKGVPAPKSSNYYLLDFYKHHPIIYRSHIVKNIAMMLNNYKIVRPQMIKISDPTIHILTEMNNFIKDKGATFVLTSVSYDQNIDDFAKQNNITYIDLGNEYRYNKRGSHWTPEGHKFVAGKILQYLNTGKH